MDTKYPGNFILNELGTRKELAAVYGVSERTIYRWLNKAAKESNIAFPSSRKQRPKPSVLNKFKGTRKQLAQKYDVSERTIYRWLKSSPNGNRSRIKSGDNTTTQNAAGSVIGEKPKKRKKHSRVPYPGESILDEPGSLREIADRYGVSVSTVSRWKRRARLDIFERQYEDAYAPELIDEYIPQEEYQEPIFEEPIEAPDIGEPWEVPGPDEDLFEVSEDLDEDLQGLKMSPKTIDDLLALTDILPEMELIDYNSAFNDLSRRDKIIYLDAYIQWCYDHDPEMFYNKETHTPDDTSPDFIATLPIWGSDFDNWLAEQRESDLYEV